LELLKRLMLGTAFLLWGVVQLMPASNLAAELAQLRQFEARKKIVE
jgi:hypothetical protein